jgi:hypothetical protein
MAEFVTHRNEKIKLGPELGKGGEACIYHVASEPGLVAKIYHPGKNTDDRHDKIMAMLARPPYGTTGLAWPTDVLYHGRDFAGYLMPKVEQQYTLLMVYNPIVRAQKCRGFNYKYLLHTARNLWIAAQNVHQAGHVIGDVNESNALVNNRAIITLVDTDSFQITDPLNGRVFLCPVAKPDYLPPEMAGKDLRRDPRTKYCDRFSLGILTYQLLMDGTHPYLIDWPGPGEKPETPVRISQGMFPHLPGSKYRPAPISPDFDLLPPDLRDLFIRCFGASPQAPASRPDPQDWIKCLTSAEAQLIPCHANHDHFFFPHSPTCPWCERQKRMVPPRKPAPSRIPRNLPRPAWTRRQPQNQPRPTPVSWPTSTPSIPPARTGPVSRTLKTAFLKIAVLMGVLAIIYSAGQSACHSLHNWMHKKPPAKIVTPTPPPPPPHKLNSFPPPPAYEADLNRLLDNWKKAWVKLYREHQINDFRSCYAPDAFVYTEGNQTLSLSELMARREKEASTAHDIVLDIQDPKIAAHPKHQELVVTIPQMVCLSDIGGEYGDRILKINTADGNFQIMQEEFRPQAPNPRYSLESVQQAIPRLDQYPVIKNLPRRIRPEDIFSCGFVRNKGLCAAKLSTPGQHPEVKWLMIFLQCSGYTSEFCRYPDVQPYLLPDTP